MEKKIYSRPSVSETKLDSEIILMQISGQGGVSTSNTGGLGMGMDETNQTDGTGISQFMNPLKWFR
jgi:hypothetical protein